MNALHATSEVASVRVPLGELCVMGDDRGDGFDGRDPEFGFVGIQDIVGQPILICGPKTRDALEDIHNNQ